MGKPLVSEANTNSVNRGNGKSEIVLENVVKSFGRIRALDGVSLRIDRGEKVAILGPNGAGKTTLVRIISGQTRATSGRVEVMGKNPSVFSRELKRNIGFVSHNPMLYDELTAYENLKFYAKLYDADEERIPELLKKVKLYERRHSRVKTFSRGMKQRLAIARALIHDPRILVLDEPTSGLDVEGRFELLSYLRAFEDRTIILTTHNLWEAEKLCDRAVILMKGKIVKECSTKEVEKAYLELCGLEFD